jgi:hypothetical protein
MAWAVADIFERTAPGRPGMIGADAHDHAAAYGEATGALQRGDRGPANGACPCRAGVRRRA